MVFEYQRTGFYIAQAAEGLEQPAAEELVALGATSVAPRYRALRFAASAEKLYRIVYTSHVPSRVLAPLITFDCHSEKYLYQTTRALSWEILLDPSTTFAVSATIADSAIKHSGFAALRLKDAVVDRLREHYGIRPDVDVRNPAVHLILRIERNRATVSVDVSGGAQHRRGYRAVTVKAPMQETLAAGIIHLTGWDGSRPLYDPFCGSGTLLAEALMRYCRIPSGYLRVRFGFMRLPDFDEALWMHVKAAADGDIRAPGPGLIAGSDRSREAVAAACTNLARLPHGSQVRIEVADFRDLPDLADRVIVSNPPHGVRLGTGGDAAELFGEIGAFLREKCPRSEAYLYAGDPSLLKHLKLRGAWKHRIMGGGLTGTLAKYVQH